VHRSVDAWEGAATTNVGNSGRKLRIAGRWIRGQQSANGHDHAGLAIAALRNLVIDPRLLNGRWSACAQALDGRDVRIGHRSNGNNATAGGFAVHVYGASPASGDAAPELRACQIQFVTNNPEERRVRFNVEVVDNAIHMQTNSHDSPPIAGRHKRSMGWMRLARVHRVCHERLRDFFPLVKSRSICFLPDSDRKSGGSTRRGLP
jgi:hypothetical protein